MPVTQISEWARINGAEMDRFTRLMKAIPSSWNRNPGAIQKGLKRIHTKTGGEQKR